MFITILKVLLLLIIALSGFWGGRASILKNDEKFVIFNLVKVTRKQLFHISIGSMAICGTLYTLL